MKRFVRAGVIVCASMVVLLSEGVDALEAGATESFFNAYLPEAMAYRHIPGLAITVVQGEKTLFTGGYGVADIVTNQAVDPAKTLFDVQSVAKLIVATSVMIAAERGLVDLNADVNDYLQGLRLPATFDPPITLAALLTHTSGLEDRGMGTTARTQAEIQPLGDFLARTLTQRIAPPFLNILYSDQGMSLAAYTIASASGIPFDEYARLNVFQPLGMNSTYYFQVPPSLEKQRAASYSYEKGALKYIPHDYYNIWPSSSLWTTAADMSRFIALHLENGKLDGSRILSVEAMQRLHGRQFSYNPQMAGVCFDFFEHFENGRRLLIHSGAGSGFLSELVLLPAEGVGYFMTYNGFDGSLIEALRSAFLDRFYPAQATVPVKTINMTPEELSDFQGWYWSNRNDRRSIEKLTSLVDGYVEVVTLGNALDVGSRLFLPVDKALFVNQESDEPEYITFRQGPDGRATYLLSSNADAPFEHVPWFYGQRAQLVSVGLSFLTFTLIVLYTAIALVRRRKQERMMHWASTYCFLLALANIATLAFVMVNLAASSRPSVAVLFQLGMPGGLQIVLHCMSVLAVFNLASPVVAGYVWRRSDRQPAMAVLLIMVSAITLLYVWFLATWNIISFG